MIDEEKIEFGLFGGEDKSIKSKEKAVGAKDILKVLHKLLQKRFPTEPQKTTIQPTAKGYSIACPYCGDSNKDAAKKRGKIYLDTSSFKCWNGGCFTYRPLHVFLEQFSDGELSISQLQSLSVDHIVNNNSNKKSLAEFYDEKFMHCPKAIAKAHGLVQVDLSVDAYHYLTGRNAYDTVKREDMYWNSSFKNLYTFNTFNGKVIGVQLRLSKPLDNGSRFISYSFSDIYKKILKTEDFDEEFAKEVDRISLMYNLLNVDFSKKVSIFESALDSKYFNNSMALWGSNNIISFPNAAYFFDDDIAGRAAAIKRLNSGSEVFLWRKFKKDYPFTENCKDFNDIFKNFPKMVRKKNSFYDYLGSSVFDKNWL